MCMCSKSFCIGEFDGGADSCPIKCRRADGSRFGFTGVPKSCSCDICKCKCNFVCNIADVDKIVLARKSDFMTPHNQSAFDYSTTTPNFLRNIMSDAFKFGMDNHKKDVLRRSSSTSTGGKIDDELETHLLSRAASNACHHAALNIVTKSQDLTLLDRKQLRQGLSKPVTKLKLPSGDFFDTKSLVGSEDKHAVNNRLKSIAGNSTPFKPAPGMRTRLDIDYGNISTSFEETISGFQNIDNVIDMSDCQEEKKPAAKRNPKTEQICSNKKELGHASKNAISLLESSSDEEDNGIFEKMHDRMIKRARLNISSSIEARMNDNDNIEKKKETSKWKKTLSKLNNAKKEGMHIDILNDVSTLSDGNILKSNDPPSSQDMLERVSIYYDTD